MVSRHIKYFEKEYLGRDEIIMVGIPAFLRVKGSKDGFNRNYINWLLHRGYVFVTNLRIVFYRKGYFGEILEEIPLTKISSKERRTFLQHRIIRIFSSTSSLEFEIYGKKAEKILFSQL